MKLAPLLYVSFSVIFYLSKAADDATNRKPRFLLDLNQPAPVDESEDEGSHTSRIRPGRSSSSEPNHVQLPALWTQTNIAQTSKQKESHNLESHKTQPKEKKYHPQQQTKYSMLTEEQKERRREQKRKAYAAKSADQKKALSLKIFQTFKDRLESMSSEERAAHKARKHEWEKLNRSKRNARWVENSRLRKIRRKQT